jgi:phytoene dehydrogenase-like protein
MVRRVDLEERVTDVVVVGSGPNGLAAAIVLAEHGRSVRVVEGADRIGGGITTAELTLPGYAHDVCSAIHPYGVASPFFSERPFQDHGLEWVHPEAPVAHPLDDGSAVMIERSLEDTITGLGPDGKGYRRIVEPAVRNWDKIIDQIMGPLLRLPRHPLALARFGAPALLPATTLANAAFETERGKAVFAGLAGHAMLPLSSPMTSSFAIALAAPAHVVGWPFPRSGSQQIAAAMASYLAELGGSITTGSWVKSVAELPSDADLVFDVSPQQLVAIAGSRLSDRYRRRLGRYRYGPGVFKVDYALDGPVPWAAPECLRAGTVHLGGTMGEINFAQQAVAAGEHPERPFVLVAQQSLFDPTRAPEGRHTLWAYCHVPNASTVDMTDRIESQIERFAPGFRDRVLARHTQGPGDLEARNPNYVGGDIAAGSHAFGQLIARPVLSANPYRTSDKRIFLCSASTPPGAGVHGMCGYHAAHAALQA